LVVGKESIVKKFILICIIALSVTGCKNNVQMKALSANEVLKINNFEQIKIVETYNKAVAVRDWNKARGFLDGYAKKTFEMNIERYNNSADLINQENTFETKGDNLCIVKSKVDMEMFKKEEKRILTRKWIRYYLEKQSEWKIIKVEETLPEYPSDTSYTPNSKEDIIVAKVVSDFIRFSAEGNIEKAAVYLTGNLLNNAEKYKIESFPKFEVEGIKINVLGGSNEERFVRADYQVKNKKLSAIFYLVKIKDQWLIEEQIS